MITLTALGTVLRLAQGFPVAIQRRGRKGADLKTNDVLFMLEAGTERRRAMPWMGPAFEAKKGEALHVFATELPRAIDRAVKKLAKRNGVRTLMYPPVFELLAASPTVAGYVDERIYPHGYAPQRVTVSYVTWEVMGGAPENNLTAVPDTDSIVVRVRVWSDDAQAIYAIGQAVRDCLEPEAHMEDVPMTGRDPETLRAWLAMTFRFWTARFDATSSSS